MQFQPPSESPEPGAGQPAQGGIPQPGAQGPRVDQSAVPPGATGPQPQAPPAQPGAASGYQTPYQYGYAYQQYQWPYQYARRPAPQPRKGRTALIVVAVICGLLLLVGMMAAVMSMSGSNIGAITSDTIALIHIRGVIAEGAASGPFGLGYEEGTRAIVNQLDRAGREAHVKAVVIRINSPGGSAAASQEIYDAVRRVREEHHKPVVVSMGDVAASGGYYVASAADTIVANEATLTGSIGVIMQSINLSEFLGRYGVKADTIKSGPYKDSGSMFRPMTEAERQYWQTMIDDVYDQFVTAVANGRKMAPADVKKLADGRVYTGRQAMEHNLVDKLGGLRVAVQEAKKLAGITGEAQLKELRQKTLFEEMMGAQQSSRSDVLWELLQYERANPARHLLEAPAPYLE